MDPSAANNVACDSSAPSSTLSQLPSTPFSAVSSPQQSMVPATPSGSHDSQHIGGPLASGSSGSGALLPSSLVASSNSSGVGASRSTTWPVFTNSCCKKVLPTSEMLPKGNQTWCKKDTASYQALCQRWVKNPKIKVWWQSLQPEKRVEWFINWQGLSGKKRFQDIVYEESTTNASEGIGDDIDVWVTWKEFLSNGLRIPGETTQSLMQKWQETINSNRASCLFKRGQWLVPEYKGFERRTRARISQEVTVSRKTSVEDENALVTYQESGRQQLELFGGSVQAPQVADAPLGPEVLSRPQDQPPLLQPRDHIGGAIAQEASAMAREIAQRRSVEAAESLEAQSFEKPVDDAGVGTKGTRTNVGIEKTKLDGFVTLLRNKFQIASEGCSTSCDDLIGRINQHFSGQGMPESVATMKQDLAVACHAVKHQFENILVNTIESWAKRCKEADDVNAIKALTAEGHETAKHLKCKEHKDFTALQGKTKKFLTNDVWQQKLQARDASVVTSEAPANPTWTAMRDLAAQHDGVNSKSIYESKAGLRLSTFEALPGKDPVTALENTMGLKKVLKDIAAHMRSTGVPWANRQLSRQDPLAKHIEKILAKGFDAAVVTKMVVPDQPWAAEIYAPDILVSCAKHVAISATLNGCCEARVSLSGSETLVGLPYSRIPGNNMKDKRAWFSRATVDELSKLVNDAFGFICTLCADSCVLVPSGFMLCSASHGSHTLRWCVAADAQDSSRVRNMVGEMLASYPELATPAHGFTQWHDFLVESCF
eukprot:TRINITY_DN60895_c0_g1_i1.p1 TRINITY_DN60895_c0_g1~~TRINITY_DN60895_c0_g1_i1.p1  ORF type:complete len:788 (-),score=151.87 TRINITY_DN60895_c0_g1_i1:269-2575(-)